MIEKLKALGHEARLEIAVLLQSGAMPVTDICDEVELPQPVVSTMLNKLRVAGIVERRRNGKQVIYRLTDGFVSELVDLIRKGY